MLHRVRTAVARPADARSTGVSPADRLTALLAPVGGWLPPAAPPSDWWEAADERAAPRSAAHSAGESAQGFGAGQPGGELAGESAEGSADESAGESAGQWLPTSRDGPDEDGGDQRSWSPARRHALPEQARRWRLEPGRAAVGALLIVATLAALVAGGVVLRGRPQEVAAPVVEASARTGPQAAATPRTADGSAVPTVESAGVPLPGGSAGGSAAAPSGEVVVAVAGKVRVPGLVRLPAGSRVDDAVRAAGGPVDPAAMGLLNLARVLVDGEQVLVGVEPPPGSVPAGGAAGGVRGGAAGVDGAGGGLVDLNSATVADLDALPGIGPVLAQRIVDWRTVNGRFASVDQLREVTGIGEAKYQDLVAKVVV